MEVPWSGIPAMATSGRDYGYVDDDHAKPVISSGNGRWATLWPEGRA